MKPKKILFVSHTSNLYGAEKMLLILVSCMQELGHITPIVLLPGKGPLADLMKNAGVHVVIRNHYHWIGRNRTNRIFLGPLRMTLNFISLASLYSIINDLKPDVIYTNTLANPLGAMISLLYRTPNIWHAREFVQEDMNRDYDFGTKLTMSLIGKASKIICNSHAVKKKLQHTINKDIFEVVYNGFEFEPFNDPEVYSKFERRILKTKPIELMIVGQLHPGKGHQDAIRALAILRSKGHALKLSVVGSAMGKGTEQYVGRLKSLSKQLSVDDKVVWHGFVDNPFAHMSNAAIVLVCSRCEAFGNVAIEAMAKGIPVVGSNSGGLTEIIENGVTGLLYEYGNCEKLADQIMRLLKNRELYENIIKDARQSVFERFSLDRYVSEINRIIDQMCL